MAHPEFDAFCGVAFFAGIIFSFCKKDLNYDFILIKTFNSQSCGEISR
jgi:hypothetical protein